ncbi:MULTISPECIES: spore coat U domain-containing protein [unclassified Pseudomonas]|uniref:Csu type fimbrial protein n=1 Tax=unclassified Pseudomonas TaxID=196821 RepID=UPI00244B4CE4|nr:MULTISPECIES: spore coat U domain-containing protein [unclassified Pseudomonas]MDG9924075.1 spore coat U domain-containing protein [Pseudomonas sp. GD04045]MDH0036505.1 spore coat U domain-containing protein [Pseudomonas sp. GD04019]
MRRTFRPWWLPLLMLGSAEQHAVDKTASIGLIVEVLPACYAGSINGGSIDFGTLDFGTHFSLSNSVSKVGQPNAGALRVNCQQNVPYRVLINGGQSGVVASRKLLGPGAAQLDYNLYTAADYATVWDNSTGVTGIGNGQDQWLPVYGRVPAQSVPQAGNYGDTLTVTVSW